MWYLDKDYTPRIDVAPYWLMVDDVCPNGIQPREPYFYTSVAFQRYKRRKAEQPFELTREVQDLLHRALVEPDLVKPLIQEARIERGSYFSVPLAQRALPKLIERMKALAAQPRLPANSYHQSSGRKVPAPGLSGTGFLPVSPHSAYETVFLFPISQSKGKRKNYYEATRYAWRVRKGLRLRVGAIALGIDAQSSIDAFKIHRWESIPGAENYKFYGSRLPSGHELLERSYSQVIASAPGYWQWGNGLVVQFDGKGHFKFLSGSADKSWRRLNP